MKKSYRRRRKGSGLLKVSLFLVALLLIGFSSVIADPTIVIPNISPSNPSDPSVSPSPFPTATYSGSNGGSSSPVSPTNSSSSLKILRQNYATFGWSTATFAASTDIWIGHWDVVESLYLPAKNVNPSLKGLLYCNTLLRYKTGINDPAGTFTTFQNNGWLLKNSQGGYVTESNGNAYFVDFGDPAVWSWYANWLEGYVSEFNLAGVQMDNTCCDLGAFYYATSTAVNPRTGSAWTSTEVVEAYIGFVNEVQETLGNDKIILCNGVYNSYSSHWNSNARKLILDSKLTGIISEGWLGSYGTGVPVYISESAWLGNLQLAQWMQDNLLAVNGAEGLFLAICAQASTNVDIYAPSMSTVNAQQYLTYCYASMLLVASEDNNALFFGTTDSYSMNLFKIDIGLPSSDFSVISGSHVYQRVFSDGKVLVNPSSSSYTVTVGSGYSNAVSGASVGSSLTVPAHSGVILSK